MKDHLKVKGCLSRLGRLRGKQIETGPVKKLGSLAALASIPSESQRSSHNWCWREEMVKLFELLNLKQFQGLLARMEGIEAIRHNGCFRLTAICLLFYD